MTRIQDVIVPEVFNPYVIEQSAKLSAFVQSGVVERDNKFDVLAQAGGRSINMPFWSDLDGDDEVLSDSDPLTPAKITANQDVAALLMRGKAWTANDLAKALSGDDPMGAIGNLVAAYWARQKQKTLINTLTGVFASSSMSNNKHDISGEEGSAGQFIAENFIDATYKLGDAEEKLTAIAVHSATLASLRKQNLIEYQLDSNNQMIASYMGKRVIVDDSMPANNGVYSTYIFGAGAVAEGNGAAPVPTETDRDSLQGDDILINRQHFLLHPRGVAFQFDTVAGSSPSNGELATAANWNRVYDPKNVRIVEFKHKLA
ncbi:MULTISPECIES: major capsid protein [unclassified Oceanobacillus]|uniref:major capsid protein n=1 Tax=Oceanobacillus TaxID=182709 RepID=UPI001BED163B|nr:MULTISPECIES: major capsid protein [unclassified Oceanobacillus]MBT2601418.1 coat protein [Oceanobacillus sp. ISL-74]MBT2653305.1 coat protein [Oceanobacillus sp. ISL-73]